MIMPAVVAAATPERETLLTAETAAPEPGTLLTTEAAAPDRGALLTAGAAPESETAPLGVSWQDGDENERCCGKDETRGFLHVAGPPFRSDSSGGPVYPLW
jgi:hypothetical protein